MKSAGYKGRRSLAELNMINLSMAAPDMRHDKLLRTQWLMMLGKLS